MGAELSGKLGIGYRRGGDNSAFSLVFMPNTAAADRRFFRRSAQAQFYLIIAAFR
jgi:hypothetical protein